jgi:alanine racemase
MTGCYAVSFGVVNECLMLGNQPIGQHDDAMDRLRDSGASNFVKNAAHNSNLTFNVENATPSYMPRPLVARIHLSAMEHNLAIARKHNPRSNLWAIVKADGYGHGLVRSMRGFRSADGLAVIEIDDALKLRECGWQKPILLLEGFGSSADLDLTMRHNFCAVIHCAEQIEVLEKTTGTLKSSATLNVYLKINTGLNRLGFHFEQAASAHARLKRLPMVRCITLMTHFANSYALADTHPGISVDAQVLRFRAVAEGLGGECSLSDSAIVLKDRVQDADWVRPGVMLYGATCFPGIKASSLELLPAMTLESEIIGIQQIETGDGVGYGSRFIAPKAMKIGVVACGYTNGYPRSAQDGAPVLVEGIKTGLVGRVSMDKLTVDLTDIPGAHVGSKVTLWGIGLPIEEVADAANTICCELMCGLSNRVPVIEEAAPCPEG